MVQAIVSLGEYEDRVLTIVKGKFGLKNKSEAVNLIINKFEEELLEPELRPEFIQKIKRIEKEGKFKTFKNIEELKRDIENA
ncbi:antitoxin [Candidatus Woesearchaeota archaeon CG_4_10_14_0_2_um_filter_33_10]|nr:MAG: antitoxin [Candidatus Woesearchaeota archaeon CG10_big_fil_rev_8_21_14_0_10_33_12]PIU72737.1 MAG: antitoxin [Candidatus Woesearchaeota archaeon CG06_land_8_20_14_3_00_33_13]PIZ52649.1 MAG: antitoxin [Candidatus Woesearchaeota archaeon CG_4_10_14_0_2_um_filter_33_10]